jgi:hypothetical protein
MTAICKEDIEDMATRMKEGVNYWEIPRGGSTHLMEACGRGFSAGAKLLLDQVDEDGAPVLTTDYVNAADKHHHTALFGACFRRLPDIAALLRGLMNVRLPPETCPE